MSINIKTSSGLQKLTPEVNKSTVTTAIGYTPAREKVVNDHIDNSNIHVTAKEKATWNAKSEFNGDYNSLINTPDIPELPEWTQDIQDDGQGTYAIVDEQGRKALEISADGITNLAKLLVNGEDLETIIDNKIEGSDIVPNSRKVNGKELSSDINLALSDLNEAPNIVETDDGSFVIANENGTKAFEITPDGTTSVATLTVGGKTLESIIDDRIPDDYSDIVPENETDPTVSNWAKINNTDKIPEDKLPSEVDPTVASWAKNDSEELIPNDKLSISVDEVSNAVPNTRKINGKDLSADISLMLSDLNEAPDIVETDDGYFTIVDEDRNKVLEIDNLGNINVASLNVIDSNKNEIFKVSVESGITKIKALEVNQKSLEDIIDEKIAAIPDVEIPEVTMPQDTVSKITHFEMYGGEVSLSVQPDGIIYTDAGYFTLEDGNDYDFTIAQRIPLAPGDNITFTTVEDDPDTLQINAEVPTKLSELEPDNNNQRVSAADKEKWNTVTNKASITALQSHIDSTNPHKVTAEQIGLGDIRVDDTGKTFTIVDDTAEQNKAFEIASDGTVSVARLNVGGTDINEQLNTLSGQFDDYQPKGSYLTTSTASNTYLARAGGTMAGTITMNGNNISGAGTITAATFQASSDARLKENLQPLQPQASILNLPTYEFDFIDGPKDQIGCLAQDLAHIHPKLVTVNEDGYLTINEAKLVYLLLEEMKKLQSKIVDLESQLNLLK